MAFEGEDGKDTFVDAAKGFATDESLEGFDAEGEFAGGERTLVAQGSRAEAREIVGQRVFGSINDAQVLAAAAFDGRLKEFLFVGRDEVRGFDDHPLTPLPCPLEPPMTNRVARRWVGQIDESMIGDG